MKHFSINLCGVEDSVENYQTFDFMVCCYGIESYGIIFCFVTHISVSLMILMLNYAFTHIQFSLSILRLAVEMSDKQAFRSKARQIAVTDSI